MSGRVKRRELWSDEWRKWNEKQGKSISSYRRDQDGQNQHHQRNSLRLDNSSTTRVVRDRGRLGEERKYSRRGRSEGGRYLKKEDNRITGKREYSRPRCNYEDNRRIRENSDHAGRLLTSMDAKGRERSEDTRRRNIEDENQNRIKWNRGNRNISSSKNCENEVNRGYKCRGEFYRSVGNEENHKIESINIQRRGVELGTKDVDKKKDKFDPSEFQRLVLSNGVNRTKQVDPNRNVVLVKNEIESEINYENYKDYSYEYSGLLSKSKVEKSHSQDTLKQNSDHESSDQDHSMYQTDQRKLNLRTPRKDGVSRAIENRHRSPERNSSTEDDSDSPYSDISDNSVVGNIDDEYMISVMKNVVTDNFERKRSAFQRFPNEENVHFQNSDTDSKHVKKAKISNAESSSTLIMRSSDFSRHSKPSPDSDLSSNLHPIYDSCLGTAPMKTLNERFGQTKTDVSYDHKLRGELRKQVNESNYGGSISSNYDAKYLNLVEETDQLSKNRLPSPRPASASAYIDTVFTKCEPEVCEREVFQVCSPSLSLSEAEQFQSLSQSGTDLQDRLLHNVATKGEKDTCEDITSASGVKKRKFKDETDEDKMLKLVDSVRVLDEKKVVIVDAENYKPDLGKEVKYEEPSPEIFEHVDLRADARFTPITQRMHNVIMNAMLSVSEVVLSRHNIDITKHDLYTLTGTNWLNDQVVEIYLAMIAQRSHSLNYVSSEHPKIHSMSTYFFTNFSTRGYSAVKKWTKEVDIFAYDMVLVPIHMDSHWSLASIDFRVPGVFYYDSLGSTVNNNAILTALLYYVGEEHMDKKGKEINLSNYAKQTMDCPLQQNGSDCGVFCCKVGDYLSRDLKLEFCQEDIKFFRKRMIFEILRGVLLEP